ncbi:MAG TPA: trypsin-like peptidase domain-containing protein [Acidimicrobiales bacterium]|nr:trypsin-like peptidase domain-containing protein [Acidimicrobiales bacterium]
MGKVLEELSAAVRSALETVGPSVVGVGAGGSGAVVGDGVVVTNAHNLRGEETVVTFADGRRVPGRATGVDIDGDLAVLAVDTAGAGPLEWSSRPVGMGDAVLGFANPGGRGLRASVGFVSAVDVGFRGPGGRKVGGALEHTAPLARGSSGGPLVDSAGKFVGIDTHRVGDGFYLAMPANEELKRRVDALGRGEEPRRPRLGIAVAPSPVARRLRRSVGLPDRDGILVRAVEEGGPAATSGIRQGDLVVAVAGTPVASVDELAGALEGAGPAAAVELAVVRGADELTVSVRLSSPDVSPADDTPSAG